MEKESEIIYKILKLNLEKKIIQTEIDFLIDSLINDEVKILVNTLHGEENEEKK